MAKWQWAALWKRMAKNYRTMFKLCALTSVPLWKERYWASRRSARAWKATAKRWRKRALLYEMYLESGASLRDHLALKIIENCELCGQRPADMWEHWNRHRREIIEAGNLPNAIKILTEKYGQVNGEVLAEWQKEL